MANRLVLPIFYCLLLPFLARGQKANFQFYTTADGLSGGFTHDIVQDKKGFLWAFNDYQLHRFDGHHFVRHNPPAELPGSGDRLRGGVMFDDSLLACLGEEYLFLLNTETGVWQSFPSPIGKRENTFIDRFGVDPDSGQDVLILTSTQRDSDMFWLFQNKRFIPAPFPAKIPEPNRFIFGRDRKLYTFPHLYDPHKPKRLSFEIWTENAPVSQNLETIDFPENAGIHEAFQLDDGKLAVLSAVLVTATPKHKWLSGFYLIDPLTGQASQHPASRFFQKKSSDVTNFLHLRNGNVWFCGPDRQLNYYDARRDTLLDFFPTLKTLMPNVNDILFGFEDMNGTVWFGTRLGLLKVTLQESAFEHFIAKPEENCGGDCSFRGMTEDAQGNMYAAFYHGIAKFSPLGGAPVFITPHGKEWLPLPSNLHADKHGLWLNNGTLLDTETGAVQAIPGALDDEFDEDGLFAKGPDGRLWWVYGRSLYLLHEENGGLRWEKVLELTGKQDAALRNALHIGKKTGFVYLGHQGQLLQFDPRTKKETWFMPKDKGILVSRILSIEEGDDGVVWLATDVGLVRYEPKNQQVKHFLTSDGLPNNFICGMLAEGDSCLWLSTNHGLARFHIASETFISFFEEDGLTHNEFNRKSCFKASDGRMYFGGLRGINAFYPSELMQRLQRQNASARVALASFEYVDESLNSTIRQLNFPANPEIHLFNQHRAFTFEYALTDFNNPTEVLYSYQLEGYENTWSSPSKFNFTRFSSLPVGTYIFRVKAKDSHGRWHPNELAVTVVVHPPWWKTWWAYIGYALLLGGIIFGILYFLRLRWKLQDDLKSEHAEATRLKELDNFKSRLYTNLTHEFRTPLTVILGMAGQIKNNPTKYLKDGTRLIETNGQNLLRLINQLLDLSKLENKSFQLNLQQGDIVLYLRYITESFQSFANDRNLSLRFFTTLDTLEMDYDPEQIKQVLTNLISNALKFTPSGGEVAVRLTSSAANLPGLNNLGTLEIRFIDNGIGVSKENLPHIFDRFYQVDGSNTREGEGTGIGLAHTQELVQVMGGHITVESEIGIGSTFYVRLPITKNAPMSAQATPSRGVAGIENSINLDRTHQISPNTYNSELPQLLIIEDNPDVVVYLKTCLEGLYQIDVAYNGKIGIEKALENIPDLIVSDVMMPGKDGYQVCDTLKNDDRTSHIPIILLTAKADVSSKIAGLRRGADAYLTKPFDKEELLVWLEKLVERQHRMAAYFSNKINSENGATLQEPALLEAIEVEDIFIQKVRQIVAENFADEDFSLPQLCHKVGMSRSQLFRKMKALIDVSPSDFIRDHRLNEAKTLLETTDLNVSEVAWKVGYKDLSHFSKSFQEAFGVLPSATNK